MLFRSCDDEVIPLQERIESIGDEADLEEVYNTERHLLYVACTRARDNLLVTGVKPASEFLDDLNPGCTDSGVGAYVIEAKLHSPAKVDG